ncbi:MAG: diguanylate cyclase [Pseudomonadota bacterium]|nr:diguanylate cyclase [Pseudomonadota bacterium]MDP1904367.1 diguanylate cyclase [Pseudomonadota bacterium]MDP2353520.1 diguanylate cyclase [Pseudomonadota bacterium]
MTASTQDKSRFTRNTLAAIRELDIAIANHINWLRQIHAALITDTPCPDNDLRTDAHHRCEFGRWYYGEGMAQHQGESEYTAIEQVHRDMHVAARLLLTHRVSGAPINITEYEQFMDMAFQFKQDVRVYQYLLINQVCTVDHLTGAWNRHAMVMKLTEESERTQRSGQPCALCMMDIDFFKQVNDQHGHQVGDEVLQAFTSIINNALRKYDSLFRYGGEEFLMLLPETSLDNAAVLLNRIRETLAATPITSVNGTVVHLTASFGVAQLAGHEAVEDALEHADHALLAAKANGRNKVCVWEVPTH